MKILVTPRSFGSTSKEPIRLLEEKGYEITFNETGKRYSKEQMKEIVKDKDGVIVGLDDMSAEVLNAAENLKVISKYGVGVNNIDLKAAKENGIVVTNTPEANADSVADLAFAFIMSLARKIPQADRKTKAGFEGKIIGNSVWGKTLGVIGLGKIGRRLVKRAYGFNMMTLAYDLEQKEDFASKYNVRYVELEEVLTGADFVSLHVPLTDSTRGLIDKEKIEIMKEDAFLINTSRGGIIDEAALYRALKGDKIRGAALDVLSGPPAESPLKELDNVILSPHMGAHTEEAIKRMGVEAAENLITVLEGGIPETAL